MNRSANLGKSVNFIVRSVLIQFKNSSWKNYTVHLNQERLTLKQTTIILQSQFG